MGNGDPRRKPLSESERDAQIPQPSDLDCNIICEERKQAIRTIGLTLSHNSVTGVPRWMAATFQVCDLAQLEKWALLEFDELKVTLLEFHWQFNRILEDWKQARLLDRDVIVADADSTTAPSSSASSRRNSVTTGIVANWETKMAEDTPAQTARRSTPMSASKPEIQRSNQAVELAKKRDGDPDTPGLCVLTRSAGAEAAHLFPATLSRPWADDDPQNHRQHLFDYWRTFFPSQADSWQKAAKGCVNVRNVNAQVANLICLSRDAHNYWNCGYFALKPVGEDDEEVLRVQLFWQQPFHVKKHSSPRRDRIVDLFLWPPPTTETPRYSENHWLYSGLVRRELVSRDVITLITKEHYLQPLPYRILLEIAWHMNRILRMAGGGEDCDLDFDDDMSDELGVYDDDENGFEVDMEDDIWSLRAPPLCSTEYTVSASPSPELNRVEPATGVRVADDLDSTDAMQGLTGIEQEAEEDMREKHAAVGEQRLGFDLAYRHANG